ncbi:MFS transporter [Streptomyces sp. NPDC002564]|uniref:MFS transporter n=1 Tax=Streptomyces sp. NPDC002564 TaxID=3364649 RepID=UPI0036C16D63
MNRDTRFFLGASAVSFVGDGVRYAALPLLAAQAGAGAVGLGVLLGFATLPFLVLGIFGGVLADRMRRRSLLIACDALRFGITASFTVLVLLDVTHLPVLCAVAFLMGLLESVATSATFAFLPSLVRDKHLERTNGMSSTALMVGRQFLGPLLGAALVGIAPAAPFLVDAATFLISLLLVRAVPASVEAGPEAVEHRRGPRAVLADVRVSTRWMRRTPHVLTIACTAGAINLFNMGALAIQPLFATEVLGGPAIVYGLMMAAAALGGVAGAQAAGRLAQSLTSSRMVCLALLCIGVGSLVVSAAPHQAVAYVGLMLSGFGFSTWGVATTSWRQRLTPDNLRGRADALHRMIAWGVNPAGSALGGLLASGGGARLPYLLVGIAPLLLLPLYARRNDTATAAGPEDADHTTQQDEPLEEAERPGA